MAGNDAGELLPANAGQVDVVIDTKPRILYQLSSGITYSTGRITVTPGDCWRWECEAACGMRSFATYSTQHDAFKARLQHEKSCT